MTSISPWTSEPREIRNLYNPALVVCLCLRAADGYYDESKLPIPMTICMAAVGLSLVVDERDKPGNITSNLVTWIEKSEGATPGLGMHISDLRGQIKRGILFGFAYDLLSFLPPDRVGHPPGAKRISAIPAAINSSRTMQRAAHFYGRWLYRNGSEATVLALLGVRP